MSTFKINDFFNVYICLYVCHMYTVPSDSRKEYHSPWDWSYSGCEPPHRHWKLSPGFLQEKSVSAL